MLGLLVALVADVAEQRVCELPLVVHHVGLHPQPLHGTVNLVDVLVLVCGGSGESRTTRLIPTPSSAQPGKHARNTLETRLPGFADAFSGCCRNLCCHP